MNIEMMVKHYKAIFHSDKDSILKFIQHDMNHMGISVTEQECHLNEARRILEA